MVTTIPVPIVRFNLLWVTWVSQVAVQIFSAVTVTSRVQQISVFSRTLCLVTMDCLLVLGSTGHVSGVKMLSG